MSVPGNSKFGKARKFAAMVVRQCAGLATFVFCLAVTAMAMAQQSSSGRFKAAPLPEGAEGDGGLDYILGIHVNTIFLVTVAAIGVFWFTLGGGRKAKVGRDIK